MYFSRVKIRPDIQKSSQLQRLLLQNSYGVHQLLWDLFPGEKERSFLFREEIAKEQLRGQHGIKGESIYYVLSKQQPEAGTPLFEVESKSYEPVLEKSNRFGFKLRVNPIEHGKTERTETEAHRWLESRRKRGLPEKPVTKKRIRHDIIMAAKRRIGWKELSVHERPSLSSLVQKEGEEWLRRREGEFGFVLEGYLRVDGYRWHSLPQKGQKAGYSTLDFEGELKVADKDLFKQLLFDGIGPAKGFGCGLFLIRRI